MIKIDFEFDTPHGVFRDALHLPDDHAFTEDEIQAMKEQRRDNWIAVVTAPPVEPEAATLDIAGEVYQRLDGVPPSGAKLVEVEGVWYYKV
jgi:hypothetical protein